MKIKSSKTFGASYRVLFAICFLISTLLWGQETLIDVSAAVDKSIITIGDRVTYTLTIDRNKELQIHDPGKGTNLGAFEVKDYKIFEPEIRDDRIVEKFEYTISVYDTGKFVIPPFPVAYLTSDTTSQYQFITAEPLEIYAKSILNDPNADIMDISPPFFIPPDYLRLALIALGVILLLVLGWLGYRYYRKRQENQPIFKKKVVRPPHEIALEALAALEGSKLLAEGKEKAFFTELSNITRQYIEGRFFIKAMEETTSEIATSLRENDVQDENLDYARKSLQNCDLVKFAKYLPGEKGATSTVLLTRKFIEQTMLTYESDAGEEAPLETEKAES